MAMREPKSADSRMVQRQGKSAWSAQAAAGAHMRPSTTTAAAGAAILPLENRFG